MLFKYKFITKYLFFVLITLCSGQQYFSPLIPNNYFIPNAADLAKGQFSQVHFLIIFSKMLLKIIILKLMLLEIHMLNGGVFQSLICLMMLYQNVYALNRPAFTSYAWSFSADLNQKYKMPFLVSISDGLFWDFRYDYNEKLEQV